MLSDNRTQCFPQLASLGEYAAASRKHFMQIAEDMLTDTETLPDELKPYGEALTRALLGMLAKVYLECLTLYSELGLQEIARAFPATQQTEQEL